MGNDIPADASVMYAMRMIYRLRRYYGANRHSRFEYIVPSASRPLHGRRAKPAFKLPHGSVTIRFGGRSRSPLRPLRRASSKRKHIRQQNTASFKQASPHAQTVGAILIARAITQSCCVSVIPRSRRRRRKRESGLCPPATRNPQPNGSAAIRSNRLCRFEPHFFTIHYYLFTANVLRSPGGSFGAKRLRMT